MAQIFKIPENLIGNEVVIERIFEARVEKVWNAWTEPELLKKWWGPKGFTTPECRLDLREGGKYLFCMRSPEGQDIWSTGKYIEIIPSKKIVCTDSFSDKDGNVVPASNYGMEGDFPDEMYVTVTFEDIGNKTGMILRHAGLPDGTMKDMTVTGWNELFDKLDHKCPLKIKNCSLKTLYICNLQIKS
jgi:uncharacterized protein YndB with AHSA1/START domain